MKRVLSLICFIIPFSLHADDSPTLKERIQHFLKGSAKLAFVGANVYLIAQAADILYEDMQTLAPALRNYIWDDKIPIIRWEMLCEAVSIVSFALVSFKCFKSGMHSFQRAFEKTNVIKRDVVP